MRSGTKWEAESAPGFSSLGLSLRSREGPPGTRLQLGLSEVPARSPARPRLDALPPLSNRLGFCLEPHLDTRPSRELQVAVAHSWAIPRASPMRGEVPERRDRCRVSGFACSVECLVYTLWGEMRPPGLPLLWFGAGAVPKNQSQLEPKQAFLASMPPPTV